MCSIITSVVVWAVLLRVPQGDVRASRALVEELRRSPRVRRFLRSRIEPGVATGLALSIAMIAAVLAGSVIGVLTYMVRRDRGVVSWDLLVARWAAAHADPAATRVLTGFTSLGMTLTIVVVSVAAAAYGHRRWHRASIWLFLLLVVGGQFLIANLIKVAVERVRPAIHPLASFSGASFPSGHTTAAAATFAALSLVLGRGRSPRVRATLGGAAAGIAVAVGCSRMFLGVHWLSDVIAGLVLGWAWFAICCVAFGGRLLRFGAPAEAAAETARGLRSDAGGNLGRTRP